MTKTRRFSPEVRERAVWLVRDHKAEYAWQWGAITSIARPCPGNTFAGADPPPRLPHPRTKEIRADIQLTR